MSKINLNRLLKKTPGFWFFHLTGWLAFIAIQVNTNFERFSNSNFLISWIDGIIIGFFLTLGLRYIYKAVFTHLKNALLFIFFSSLCSFIIGFIWPSLNILLDTLFHNKASFSHNFNEYWNVKFTLVISRLVKYATVIFYWSILYFGIKFKIEITEENRRRKDAALHCQNLRLSSLKHQLNPHFLFNSLNSIQSLMYADVSKADKMLTGMAEILRYNLNRNDNDFVNLETEIAITKKYLNIEKFRFENKLDFEFDVPQKLLTCIIPNFTIQPLVENAIKYGNTNKNGVLKIRIKLRGEKDILNLEIQNTGKWKSHSEKGIGLKNLKNRFEVLYKEKSSIDILDMEEWVIVKLIIPLKWK